MEKTVSREMGRAEMIERYATVLGFLTAHPDLPVPRLEAYSTYVELVLGCDQGEAAAGRWAEVLGLSMHRQGKHAKYVLTYYGDSLAGDRFQVVGLCETSTVDGAR